MAYVPIISNGTVVTQDCQSCGGYGWQVGIRVAEKLFEGWNP